MSLCRETETNNSHYTGIQQPLLPTGSLPASAVGLKGVVYTKRWVVELLLDLAGYRSEDNLVDAIAVEPSRRCWPAAFLGAIIERLMDSCERLGRSLSDCGHSLIAYEINEESAARVRALSAGILRERNVEAAVAEHLADCWVRTGDYLFEATGIKADFVLGNPPYVRLEDIPDDAATLYRDAYPTMRGRADLYVAFFEAGLQQLKKGGVCAFICADRWMRNQYGAELAISSPRNMMSRSLSKCTMPMHFTMEIMLTLQSP